MKFLGLRTIVIKVDDIVAAREWYTEVLGTKPYFDEPFYVGFNVAGYELGLQPKERISDVPSSAVTPYWGVEDVESAYQRLLSLGATSVEAPVNVGGPLVVASVSDPWGNVFGIIFNPEFTPDKV